MQTAGAPLSSSVRMDGAICSKKMEKENVIILSFVVAY